MFRIFDRDGDRRISRHDFFRSVELLGREAGAEGAEFMMQGVDEQWEALWDDMDKDGDGTVNEKEFVAAIRESRKEEESKRALEKMRMQMGEKRRRALLIARVKGELKGGALPDELKRPKKKKVASLDPRITAFNLEKDDDPSTDPEA